MVHGRWLPRSSSRAPVLHGLRPRGPAARPGSSAVSPCDVPPPRHLPRSPPSSIHSGSGVGPGAGAANGSLRPRNRREHLDSPAAHRLVGRQPVPQARERFTPVDPEVLGDVVHQIGLRVFHGTRRTSKQRATAPESRRKRQPHENLEQDRVRNARGADVLVGTGNETVRRPCGTRARRARSARFSLLNESCSAPRDRPQFRNSSRNTRDTRASRTVLLPTWPGVARSPCGSTPSASASHRAGIHTDKPCRERHSPRPFGNSCARGRTARSAWRAPRSPSQDRHHPVAGRRRATLPGQRSSVRSRSPRAQPRWIRSTPDERRPRPLASPRSRKAPPRRKQPARRTVRKHAGIPGRAQTRPRQLPPLPHSLCAASNDS